MATAAQLRARAAFSKIMKSGGFPPKKKRSVAERMRAALKRQGPVAPRYEAGTKKRRKNPGDSTRSRTRTSTSTKARTTGNVTVTGGAGRGATTDVTIRKNPAKRLGRSGASGRQGIDADFNRQQRGLARGGKNSRGNPIFEISSSDATYQREKNPAKRKPVKKASLARSRSGPYFPTSRGGNRGGTVREMNPTRPVMSYMVYEARHGVAGKALGAFPTKPAAVQFGRAWSDLKQCPVLIHGRGAR